MECTAFVIHVLQLGLIVWSFISKISSMVFQNILFRMSGKRVLYILWVICILVKSQTLNKLEKIAGFDSLNLREVTLSFKKSSYWHLLNLKIIVYLLPIVFLDYGVFIAWCISSLVYFKIMACLLCGIL